VITGNWENITKVSNSKKAKTNGKAKKMAAPSKAAKAKQTAET
jgi:hypothetical protein